MSTLLILAIQSKGTAILVILSLLLVAALISYLTAWLYTKSIYVKKIKIIESEKEELNKQITVLNKDINDLKENLSEKDDEISELKNKLKA
jgi:peptidoglycan hydrolase CwlO-like protein